MVLVTVVVVVVVVAVAAAAAAAAAAALVAGLAGPVRYKVGLSTSWGQFCMVALNNSANDLHARQ